MRNFIFFYILIFILSINNTYGQYAIAGVKGKIYTDIIPDKEINESKFFESNYNIDLNKDGTDDIIIKAHGYTSPGLRSHSIRVESLNGNTRLLAQTDSILYTTPTTSSWSKRDILNMYNHLDTIKLDSFKNDAILASEYSMMGEHAAYRDWINKGDKYFGVKYSDSNGEYYGWVKVDVQSANELIIKEYSLGIPCENKNFVVFPNPTNSIVYFQYCEEFYNISKIALYNSLGQLIFDGNFSASKPEIDLTGLANGCYYFTLYSDNSIIKRGKIIKAN